MTKPEHGQRWLEMTAAWAFAWILQPTLNQRFESYPTAQYDAPSGEVLITGGGWVVAVSVDWFWRGFVAEKSDAQLKAEMFDAIIVAMCPHGC